MQFDRCLKTGFLHIFKRWYIKVIGRGYADIFLATKK